MMSESSELPPILSSEFLTQTIASLRIRGSEAGRQFGIIPVIKAVNKLTNDPPKIILCLRDPIEHFCSLFLRIVRLGSSKKEDFNKYVKYQLKSLGVKKIDIIDKDTYNQRNNFFSARRSLHKKQDDNGRNISLIMIN